MNPLPTTRYPLSTTSSIAVAHVVLSLDVGGLERLVVDLVREGRRSGQEQAVICVERPGELAPRAEALGARVFCAHKSPGIRPTVVNRLANLFRGLRPDIVHTHQIGALFYAGPAAARAGVPVIVHTEHGKHYEKGLRARWLGRMAGRYADRFCCVSADIADAVRKRKIVGDEKITVVANGIDVARFGFGAGGTGQASGVRRQASGNDLRSELGIPPGAPLVGTIGRLSEIKRHDLLLHGFARLLRSRPEAHLLVVGDGPLRENLKRQSAATLPAAQVHFAGYQPEPERYLQVMDVFALTSRSEGMPLAVLEAWSAGVPVVASAVGGVPELVVDGQAGLLFPSGDADALAQALERLLCQPELAGRLSAVGRQRVEREFSLARMAETYQRLYRELFERQASGVVGEGPRS